MAARKRTVRPAEEPAAPDTEQADIAHEPVDAAVDESDPVVDEPEQRPARRRSPVWMVPTDDGMVPERDLRQR